MKSIKEHSDKCSVSYKGSLKIVCREDEIVKKKVDKKKVREDIVDEIDTNGNGRLTKKEIKDWINKDK